MCALQKAWIVTIFFHCAYLRGAFPSKRSERPRNRKKKPPATSSPGDDARRWRETVSEHREIYLFFSCPFSKGAFILRVNQSSFCGGTYLTGSSNCLPLSYSM